MSERWEELARSLGEFIAQDLGASPPPRDCSDVEWYAHTLKLVGQMVPQRTVLEAVSTWRKQLGLDR